MELIGTNSKQPEKAVCEIDTDSLDQLIEYLSKINAMVNVAADSAEFPDQSSDVISEYLLTLVEFTQKAKELCTSMRIN